MKSFWLQPQSACCLLASAYWTAGEIFSEKLSQSCHKLVSKLSQLMGLGNQSRVRQEIGFQWKIVSMLLQSGFKVVTKWSQSCLSLRKISEEFCKRDFALRWNSRLQQQVISKETTPKGYKTLLLSQWKSQYIQTLFFGFLIHSSLQVRQGTCQTTTLFRTQIYPALYRRQFSAEFPEFQSIGVVWSTPLKTLSIKV